MGHLGPPIRLDRFEPRGPHRFPLTSATLSKRIGALWPARLAFSKRGDLARPHYLSICTGVVDTGAGVCAFNLEFFDGRRDSLGSCAHGLPEAAEFPLTAARDDDIRTLIDEELCYR